MDCEIIGEIEESDGHSMEVKRRLRFGDGWVGEHLENTLFALDLDDGEDG